MIPPRRYPSQPDAMPAPEFVYRALQEHEDRLSALDTLGQSHEDRLDGIDTLVKDTARDLKDEVKDAVREIKASNGNETRKLIAAIAGSAITMLGGVIGVAKLERPAPPITIPRSTLDIRLDLCRPLGPGPSREECFDRIVKEVERP